MKILSGLLIIMFSISCVNKGITNENTITPNIPVLTTQTTEDIFVKSPTKTNINITPYIPGYKGLNLVDGICDQYNCLFRQEEAQHTIMGLGSIVGYYSNKEKTAWGETKVCNLFTITDGNRAIIEWFLYLIIDAGNTVNTTNEKGQPVVNIELLNLTDDEIETIMTSSPGITITMSVIINRPAARGAPVCESFFSIIKAYDYNIFNNN
jgi:hypothetical protein